MIIEHGTLVVAADGGGASVYRNAGQQGALKLESVETHDAKHASFTREGNEDGPGQYDAPAGGKTALAGHDYHEQGETEFAKRLAGRLDALLSGQGKPQTNMVLFASPRFLGAIRPMFSPRVKSAMVVEIAKDLRAAPASQIEQALTSHTHA